MKKNSLLYEDNMEVPKKVEGWKESSKQHQELLFILKGSVGFLEFFNENCRKLFLSNPNSFNSEKTFLKNIIHPNHYEDVVEKYNSIIDKEQDHVLFETQFLLKERPVPFLLEMRPYKAFPHDEVHVFIKALPIKSGISPSSNYTNGEIEITEAIQENKYVALIEAMDEAFCIIDLLYDKDKNVIDYFFIETNPSFKNHVDENYIHKTMLEIDPYHDKSWFGIYGEVANTGKSNRFQKEAEDKNYWYDLYAFRIGNNNQLAILFRNITKRKEEEEKIKKTNEDLEKQVFKRTRQLQRSKDILQTVFDESAAAIALFEPVKIKDEVSDFKILQVNKKLIDLYGRDLPLVGQKFSEISETAAKLGIIDALINAHNENKILDWEMKVDRNESDLWFRITATPQKNLVIFSLEDITKRKNEELKLKESLLFKRTMAQTSPDTILIFNIPKNELHYSNRNLADIFGEKNQDWQPSVRELLTVIHPRERRKALEFHQKLMQASDNEVLNFEFQLKIKKSWIWFNVRGKVFQRNKNGSVCEYMLLLQDITDQKATQSALIKAEKLSIKGEVARTLAHELRNPLASIGMATDVLRRKLEDGNTIQAENYLNIINRSAKVLNNLVSELLSSANYKKTSLKKINLPELLEKTMVEAADRIYLTGIKVIKEYKTEHFILADEEKLKIAILNLIVNAGEAMKPLEGILKLQIQEKKEEIILRISDNGCGLNPDQITKLFDAFYTNKSSGVGVGLSSVKNILEEHDAVIDVQSKPDEGTTFILSFRKVQEELA